MLHRSLTASPRLRAAPPALPEAPAQAESVAALPLNRPASRCSPAGLPTARSPHPPHIMQPLAQAGSTLDAIVSHGVPREELLALGLNSEELQGVSFAALLRGLPEDRAVQLQFWTSAPGAAGGRRGACCSAARRGSRRPGPSWAMHRRTGPLLLAETRPRWPLFLAACARRVPSPALPWRGQASTRLPRPPCRAAELYTMARQYRILKQLPGAFQIRFEDAQRDLVGSITPLLQEFFPNVRAGWACTRSHHVNRRLQAVELSPFVALAAVAR